MKEIIEFRWMEWKIYYENGKNDSIEIGRKIINDEYKLIDVIKDTKRNYVSLIEIENKKYILKEIKSEVVIPQRKVQTFFKDGEALSCLKNSIIARKEGIKSIAMPLLAIVKKKFFIQKSYLLLEYIDGVPIRSVNDLDEIVNITKEIHKIGRYHGDLNTSNFIKDKNDKIYILDTQMKRDTFFYFKRSYDYLTFQEDILVKELNYDISKKYKINKVSFGYLLAILIKTIKRTKVIKKIRSLKKELRKKGWKI